jgi:hypothetical protein
VGAYLVEGNANLLEVGAHFVEGNANTREGNANLALARALRA